MALKERNPSLNEESIDDNILSDEESIVEKIKKKSGIIAIIGTGVLGLLHIASHLIPALAVILYSVSGQTQPEQAYNSISIFGIDIEPIISHPIMQVFYLIFVFLSFYYIHRDHKHHKHERIIKKQLHETQRLLGSTQKELESYRNKK